MKILWKRTVSAEFREIRLKFCGNYAYPQNFHTGKLSEITVFYAVCKKLILSTWFWSNLKIIIIFWHCVKYDRIRFFCDPYIAVWRMLFLNSPSVLLNFFLNCASNVSYVLLNTYKHHHRETLFLFTKFVFMSRPRSIYIVSVWFIFIFIFIFIMINRIISWIQTHSHLFFCLFFRICLIIFRW